MSTGDAADFASRLRRVLPARWFPDAAPVLNTLLQSLGQGWADLYALLQSTKAQARLLTVSGAFLDLAAADFKGVAFLRRSGESDTLFRRRVLPIFRDRVTRAAVIARLTDLGCPNITVFEPVRPADTGGLGIAIGLGVAGGLGSLQMPAQSLIQCGRPVGQGVPYVAGLGSTTGGLGVGSTALVSLADEAPHVTDADIYAAVADTIPAGTIAWVALTGAPSGGADYWDDTFVWDQSSWA